MNTLASYFPQTMQFKPKCFELPNERILNYSRSVINTIKEDSLIEFPYSEYDCLNTCYAIGAKDLKEAKKIVRSFLFNEKFKLWAKSKAETNNTNIELDPMKTCGRCNETKPESMYYKDTNEYTGEPYARHICKECELKQKQSSIAKENKRLREQQQSYKVKARERYLRWKERQKLLKNKA